MTRWIVTPLAIGMCLNAWCQFATHRKVKELQARIEQLEQPQPYDYGDQAGACNRVIEEK